MAPPAQQGISVAHTLWSMDDMVVVVMALVLLVALIISLVVLGDLNAIL